MNLVGGVSVPDDELSILRGGDEVTAVGGPVHSIDLGQMPLERPTRLHPDTRQSLGLALCDLTDCSKEKEHESVKQKHEGVAVEESEQGVVVRRKRSAISPSPSQSTTVYGSQNRTNREDQTVPVVSANSSFLRLILSLRPSASRRAAVILACICSPLISAILTDVVCIPLRRSIEREIKSGRERS